MEFPRAYLHLELLEGNARRLAGKLIYLLVIALVVIALTYVVNFDDGKEETHEK